MSFLIGSNRGFTPFIALIPTEISVVPADASSACAIFGFLPLFAMPAILSRCLELF
jgi:hypothetical protein